MILLQIKDVISHMKENILLSWFNKEVEIPNFNWINLPLSGIPWIYSADLPSKYKVEELYTQLELEFPQGFLLRGCSYELAKHFQTKGHEILRTGAEGVVDLDNINTVSKSVLDLAKRGSKWGSIEEIRLSKSNCERVSQFIKHTPHGSKPQLNYLFNNSFDTNTRCFVMSTPDDIWLGVLTISTSSDDSCHTEMILRNENAPVGVMELLIYSVMNIYKQEGYKYFSLGEVPFVTPKGMKAINNGVNIKQSTQQCLVFTIGHLIRYAFNYKGLFDFKNKFNPKWKPVYICAAPKVQFSALIDLFCETGYLELSRSELKQLF